MLFRGCSQLRIADRRRHMQVPEEKLGVVIEIMEENLQY